MIGEVTTEGRKCRSEKGKHTAREETVERRKKKKKKEEIEKDPKEDRHAENWGERLSGCCVQLRLHESTIRQGLSNKTNA